VFCTCVLYGQPRIQLKSAEVDFGTVTQQKTQKKAVLFRNVGNEDLEVEIFKSSCGCSQGELIVKDKLVAPRETGEMIINFESKNFIGSIIKSLYVHTNDPENRKVEIKVKANVVPSFVVIDYFYSENCDECLYVEEKVLSKLKNRYNLRIRAFDIKDSLNYKYLLSLPEKHGEKNSEVPVVVVGKDMLRGVFEIEKFLEAGILETLKSKGIVNVSVEAENAFFNFFKTLKDAQIVFFFDKKCGSCGMVEKEISFLEKNKFKVVRYDIEKKERKQLNEAFCEAYNVPRDKRLTTPMVFVGEHYLTYEDLQKKPLREYVFAHREDIGVIPLMEILSLSEEASNVIQERFEKMGVFAILSAGLLDGVNPCAFATILFLVAFLSSLGKKKKETLLVGIVYSAVVFVVYFLIGIGLIRAIGALTFTVIIGKSILLLVAVFSVFLSVMSFYDYLKIKQGKTAETKLQLPRFIKKNIHSLIREKMKMRNLLAAASISGFFISFSEFVCTGQIYLPTLMFVSEVPSLRIKAILYLLLYNIAFIIPLVVVFVSVYRGISSSSLNRFWRSKVEIVKLVSTVFFLFLAGLLIFYAFFI
jgi:hypothetical protein